MILPVAGKSKPPIDSSAPSGNFKKLPQYSRAECSDYREIPNFLLIVNGHEATLKVDMAGMQSERVEGEVIQEFAMHEAMSADLLLLGYVELLVDLAVAPVHPHQPVVEQLKQAHNNALNWTML